MIVAKLNPANVLVKTHDDRNPAPASLEIHCKLSITQLQLSIKFLDSNSWDAMRHLENLIPSHVFFKKYDNPFLFDWKKRTQSWERDFGKVGTGNF